MSNNIKEIKVLLQERETRKSRLLTEKKSCEREIIEYRKQQKTALAIARENIVLLHELKTTFSEQENFGLIGAKERVMMAEVEEQLKAKLKAAKKDYGQCSQLLQIATQSINRIERKLLPIEQSCLRLNKMLKKLSASLSPGLFSATLKDRIKSEEKFQQAIQPERQEAIQWERQDAMEQAFICSITQQEMNEPVVLEGDGNSYEDAAIRTWLWVENKNISPLTGEELKNKEVWPNHALKEIISAVRANKPFHSFFICPLTGLAMKDPVILADGHSYEREAIQTWLQSHNISPVTEELLWTKEIFPNRALKTVIEAAPECAMVEKARLAPPVKKVYSTNESVKQIMRSLM